MAAWSADSRHCAAFCTPRLSMMRSFGRGFKRSLLLAVIFLLNSPLCLYSAIAPESGAQKLETLRLSWDKARAEYRDALLSSKDALGKLITEADTALENENDRNLRKKIMAALTDLRNKIDDTNDKIRALNAPDLVEYSSSKNKIVSFFSGTK